MRKLVSAMRWKGSYTKSNQYLGFHMMLFIQCSIELLTSDVSVVGTGDAMR